MQILWGVKDGQIYLYGTIHTQGSKCFTVILILTEIVNKL